MLKSNHAGALQVKKVREPHADIGCWWTLYDYGLEAVKAWPKDYMHPYPGASSLSLVRPFRLQDTQLCWSTRQRSGSLVTALTALSPCRLPTTCSSSNGTRCGVARCCLGVC